MKFRHVLLLTMLISSVYTKGLKEPTRSAKKCHQCRSDLDSRCMDLKTDIFLKVCDKNSTTGDINIDNKVCKKIDEYSCRKTTQTLYFLGGKPRKILLRECTQYVRPAIYDHTDDCIVIKAPSLYISEICECKEDGCNGCSRTRTISWLITVLSFLRAFLPP